MPRPFRPDALAYLITFRCFGTWLHGDARGSFDPLHNEYEQPPIEPNPLREAWERSNMKQDAFHLDRPRREVVAATLIEVCQHRNWGLMAAHVRSNHVHSVVAGEAAPARMMDTFKQYATRRMREAGLCSADAKPWSRHGSTIHLWTQERVGDAVKYVLAGQGEPLPGNGVVWLSDE